MQSYLETEKFMPEFEQKKKLIIVAITLSLMMDAKIMSFYLIKSHDTLFYFFSLQFV